jgi:hypothetical protein
VEISHKKDTAVTNFGKGTSTSSWGGKQSEWKNKAEDGFAFAYGKTCYPTMKRRPSHLVEATYDSLAVGDGAAAVSTAAAVGLPLWTWFRQDPPSNQTDIQYWKAKTTSLAVSIMARCITGSLVTMGGTAIAMRKVIMGIWNTPKIVWETRLLGKNYWNTTSAEWDDRVLKSMRRNWKR